MCLRLGVFTMQRVYAVTCLRYDVPRVRARQIFGCAPLVDAELLRPVAAVELTEAVHRNT